MLFGKKMFKSCRAPKCDVNNESLLTRNCLAALITFLGMSPSLVDDGCDNLQRMVWVITNTAHDRERLKRASVCLMTLGSRECPNELAKLMYNELYNDELDFNV